MTNAAPITAKFGRGKNYIARITGLHPVYKFDREFLPTFAAGNKMNCYEDYRTADVEFGCYVEIKTSNYKGVERRSFGRWTDAGLVEMSQADVAAALT